MKKCYSYKDIYLVPKYSTLASRSEAKTSLKFGLKEFKLPVMPSNMLSVIDEKWAKWLSENNYMYVMHRFNDCTIPFVKKANEENWNTISISIGINQKSISELMHIYESGYRLDYITIDVAHGHHLKVKNMISIIKKFFKDTFLIVGNTATEQATKDIESWGADATKCCIGSGMACSTKYKTGFHVPAFTCVERCASVSTKPIIADGGIVHYGDIPKALVAGADMVMCGGLFASCCDSPAPIDSNKNKIYFGNASEKAKGENKHVEGFEISIPSDITLEQKLKEIKEALQSSISYAGGKDLNCFNSIEYIIQ
jgi:GMP reductase